MGIIVRNEEIKYCTVNEMLPFRGSVDEIKSSKEVEKEKDIGKKK